MVILGGLEIVVGGYLVHRHYKHKEKNRVERERNQQRINSYPGASHPGHPQQQQQQRPTAPPQKYPSYNNTMPQAPPHHQLYPAQTFPQTRPYPVQSQHTGQSPMHTQQQPPPPLGRVDSFATISNMPVANGFTPQATMPPLPPRPYHSNAQQLPPGRPYGNANFSASSPAFNRPTNRIDQNFGREGRHTNHSGFEPYNPSHDTDASSTRLGDIEDDPPPPYRP